MTIRATPSGASVQGTSKGHYDIGPSGRRVFHTEGWWNFLNNRQPGQSAGNLANDVNAVNVGPKGPYADVLNQYLARRPNKVLRPGKPKAPVVAGGVMAPPGVAPPRSPTAKRL